MNKIEHQQIYYTVYRKRSSSLSPLPFFEHVGSYSDIRDAIQAMIAAYCLKPSSKFGLESSPNKPLHWVHRSKYQDKELT